MGQVTFIEYFFHNPFSCFLFCFFIINLIGWIEKRDDDNWMNYLIGSTVFIGAILLGTLGGMAAEYDAIKTETIIHPVNSIVSNVILIMTLTILFVYSLIKTYSYYDKKRNKRKLFLTVIENLKTDFLTLQGHIYKLESASEPYSDRKILEAQFELNEVKTMLDGIEFQKDKHKEIKRIKNKIDELKYKLLLQ